MSTTHIEAFDHTVQITNEWLRDISTRLGDENRRHAYLALRGTLHALRDFLPIDESAHLSAQLPMLVRGIYFEGWKPARNPEKYRSQEDFLGHVKEELRHVRPMDPQDGARAVFKVINHHIDPGEAADVLQALPKQIRIMWPAGGDPTSA